MNSDCPYAPCDLLPHGAPAILLDRVIRWKDSVTETEVIVRPGIPFYVQGKGVPAHVGLEYMAQNCGICAGLRARNGGEDIRMGYLLGTRDFKASIAWFSSGSTLVISSEEIYNQESMACFACRIACEGEVIASAQLNVFQPAKGNE